MSDNKTEINSIWGDALEEMHGPIIYDETAEPVIDYCGECGHETGSHKPHAKECQCLNCRQGRLWARIWAPDPDEGKRSNFWDHVQREAGVSITIPKLSDLKPGG